MNGGNFLIKSGTVIYMLLSGIDRFVTVVPNDLYIPIAMIGIVMILAGMIKDRKQTL